MEHHTLCKLGVNAAMQNLCNLPYSLAVILPPCDNYCPKKKIIFRGEWEEKVCTFWQNVLFSLSVWTDWCTLELLFMDFNSFTDINQRRCGAETRLEAVGLQWEDICVDFSCSSYIWAILVSPMQSQLLDTWNKVHFVHEWGRFPDSS